MPVRNESWILGLSARVALSWCDNLCILNHASTDSTVEIIAELQAEYPGRVQLVSEPETMWDEMAHRQTLLRLARDHGATHIAIVDADEILTGNLLGDIRRRIEGLPPGSMFSLPLHNLRGGISKYHANGVWGNRWLSTAFRDCPAANWRGDKFHSREPEGIAFKQYRLIPQGIGGVLHLWGADERRLIAKHALFKVTERLRWPDKPVAEIDRMYSWAIYGDTKAPYAHFGTPHTWKYTDVPDAWWEPYIPWLKYLDPQQEPWQEAEVRRLMAEHGSGRFDTLDLFGVA